MAKGPNASDLKNIWLFSGCSGSELRKIRSALDELVVTDTIPLHADKRAALPNLKVLSTAAMFGDAILRIHGGRSISEMME